MWLIGVRRSCRIFERSSFGRTILGWAETVGLAAPRLRGARVFLADLVLAGRFMSSRHSRAARPFFPANAAVQWAWYQNHRSRPHATCVRPPASRAPSTL